MIHGTWHMTHDTCHMIYVYIPSSSVGAGGISGMGGGLVFSSNNKHVTYKYMLHIHIFHTYTHYAATKHTLLW